ncbi:hypothetical protein GCM10027570_30180 [Streptomonospora sediminis]
METATAPPWDAVIEGGGGSPPLAVRGRGGGAAQPRAPLVLLHGLGGSVEEWEPVAALLAPHRAVYAFDQRGHGRSGDGPATVEGHLADLERVVEHFELRAPVVVGHDLGGAVAALFATRRTGLTAAVGIDAYGSPRAAVLTERLGLGAAAAAAGAAACHTFIVDQMAAAASPMPPEVFDRLLASYRFGAFGLPGGVLESGALRSAVCTQGLVSLRPEPRVLRALYADLIAYDTETLTAGLRAPLLSLVARRPLPQIPGAPARFSEFLAAQAAHELSTGAGDRTCRGLDSARPAHIARPEAVAEAVEAFLSGLAPG